MVRQLAAGGRVALGDIHAAISSLYFRGKRAYAARFGRRRSEGSAALVITPDRGLIDVDAPVSIGDLRCMADVDIDPGDGPYRGALLASARRIDAALETGAEVVLLGSIASDKYLPILAEVWGERLLFPETFVGRGDMSRGGVMLRAVRDGEELTYVTAVRAVRTGRRPPRLG